MIPCTDFDTATDSDAKEYVSNETNHEHENHPDFCSPFCVCSCCGLVINVPKTYKWQFRQPIIKNFKEKTCFYYSHNWRSEYLKDVFRPPQFS